ncbi:MAG: hypothetical protein Q8P95_01655 [bacterium]|nr:hypothetical protein [bacterium]
MPILDEDTGPDLSSEVKPPSVSTQAAPLPGKADDDDTKPDLVFRPPSAEPADDTVSGPALTSCAGEPVEGLLMVDFDDLPVVRQGLDDSFDVTDLRTPPSFPEVAPPAASPESALEETRPVPDFEPPEDRSDEDLFADDKIVDALDFPPSQTQEVPASLDATGIMPGFEIPGLVESGRARRRVVGSEPHGGLEETALQPMDLPPEPDPELGDLQDEPQDLPEFSPQEFLAHELGSGVWQPGEDLGDVRRAMAIFKAKNNISADQKMTPFEFSCFLLTTCSVRLHPSLPAKELAVRAIVQAGAQIAERHGISHFPTHFALGCDGGTVAFYYNQI